MFQCRNVVFQKCFNDIHKAIKFKLVSSLVTCPKCFVKNLASSPGFTFSCSCQALNINELEVMGGTKEGHDGRASKSKAWYAKSRDPHTFL